MNKRESGKSKWKCHTGSVLYERASSTWRGSSGVLLTLALPLSDGAFQTGHIALRRALRSENNHGRHTEGSFQTEVLKTGHFKRPFGMKDATCSTLLVLMRLS